LALPSGGGAVVMSLHRLSAGSGYRYLLRHTCSGDVQRAADTPLTSYYTATGYPPGRWVGTGVAGLGGAAEVAGPVTEQAMEAVFGHGKDPITGEQLGRAYRHPQPLETRIDARVARLGEMPELDRVVAVERIRSEEATRRPTAAVAGFDLTFTAPKSLSVLWAVADPDTQRAIAQAHRAAVEEVLGYLEQHALFTRAGTGGVVRLPTRGAVGAAFDHWDTRTGDPNLHTHVVLANRVQGPDGTWRTIDGKALFPATVALSEMYDNLVADHATAALGISWEARHRGPRRTPGFEVAGIGDELLIEFSTRSAGIRNHLQQLVADFQEAHDREPSRVEVVRLRQTATLMSRPPKSPRALPGLLAEWRERAARRTHARPNRIVAGVLSTDRARRARIGARDAHAGRMPSAQVTQRPRAKRSVTRIPHGSAPPGVGVGADLIDVMADVTIAGVLERRATWTYWNLRAEAERASRHLRMPTTAERMDLTDRIVASAIDRCVPIETGTTGEHERTPRPEERRFTSTVLLDAEKRLLAAARETDGPRAGTLDRQVTSAASTSSQEQVEAVERLATSGRRLDLLVGPAGSGKTAALQVLRQVWEQEHGTGSVIGLATSASAAGNLEDALGISCENTAKWLHESSGPGAQHRAERLTEVRERLREAQAREQSSVVASLEAAEERILAEQARWSLQPDQLLIVDEASATATLALDQIAEQARHVGAKILLVGDPHQLDAVAAGGAFRLLARRTGAVELHGLWRFRQRWEANASRGLRKGNPAVLRAYAGHDRLHEGPAEVMVEAAFRAWTTAEHAGQRALLVASDNDTVSALNTRARLDRIQQGDVEPDGAPLHDGSFAGVGDRIVTRANDRTLRTPSGWVRNADLWDVTERHHDGSLTVTAASDTPRRANPVQLPADYVRDNVELGYATTIHRAQGLTADVSMAVLQPGVTREAAYVAMTRGRTANHAYVATDSADVDHDGAPTPPADGAHILRAILAHPGAELSATESLGHKTATPTWKSSPSLQQTTGTPGQGRTRSL
jgi:conjugative relaxase-like TrwC/TraI family protein